MKFSPGKMLFPLLGSLVLAGCASLMSTVTGGMAANLGTAIRNQDDPATVRDGAPAYLLMLDSLLEASPDDVGLLISAADLYAAYGVLFAEDPARASRLTHRALDYGRRALCASDSGTCGLGELRFAQYVKVLDTVRRPDIAALFSYGQAWLAFIRVHSGDMAALARLPHAEAVFHRVQALDAGFRAAAVNHYLGVLNTIRPPALGGDFESGRAHFETAITASSGHDLSIQVDFARYYARTLYDRDLHDHLLSRVLEADPVQAGHTLFNVIAQEQARQLLATADDHF